MHTKLVWHLCCCLAVFSMAGCDSGGPALGKVSGKVTLDDKPVPGAIVAFKPEMPNGTPSYGGTDDQGNYSLMLTRDKAGAMVGKHNVTIETNKLSDSEIADMKAEGQEAPAGPFVAIPEKYRQPGALTANVESGSNEIDFALTSK